MYASAFGFPVFCRRSSSIVNCSEADHSSGICHGKVLGDTHDITVIVMSCVGDSGW